VASRHVCTRIIRKVKQTGHCRRTARQHNGTTASQKGKRVTQARRRMALIVLTYLRVSLNGGIAA